MRIIIIGAGPTGLGAAYRLQELGHEDFTVYEREPYFGGLATSFHDAEGFTWDFAVHVAHSHYHYFDRLMEELLPDGFYTHIRKAWVWEYERFIPYPFQNNIRHLPPEALYACVKGLTDLDRRKQRGEPTPAFNNFEEWIRGIFGEGIAQHFLLPYNEKIWSTPPAEMNHTWTGDRVPQVDLERILKNIIFEQDDVNWGPNATFHFPKEGGTGAIWKALGERIAPERMQMSQGIQSIDPRNKTVTLANGETDHYDHLISTIPIKSLCKLAQLDELSKLASQLKHTHTQVLGVAPRQPMPERLKDKTWIYAPEKNTCFYRVTPFSNFSPAHVPDPETACSFLCEVSTPDDQPMMDPAHFESQVLSDLQSSGLIEFDPSTVHTHYMESAFGYPVPSTDRNAILDELQPRLAELNLYSRGRFGGWKYEVANMDHSLMQGVECVNHLLNGEEEITLFDPNRVNAGKQ